MLGLGLSPHQTRCITTIRGSSTSEFPLKYLGMPLHYDKLGTAYWMPFIEKITKKLATWKGKLLSMAGRVTLINSVILPMVVFWMSNFLLPSGIIKQIDKLCRAFLSSGKERNRPYKNVLKWSMICHPKDFRGTGIIDLKLLNELLMCRWWWKLFNEAPKPWNTLMKAGYFKDQEISLKTLKQQKLSSFWKNVQQVANVFLVKFRVQNGQSTSFWQDVWLYDHSLLDRNYNLYILSSKVDHAGINLVLLYL